jgi:hypothetical protein
LIIARAASRTSSAGQLAGVRMGSVYSAPVIVAR